MKHLSVANAILDRVAERIVQANFRSNLNENLHEMALTHGIELPNGLDLVGNAVAAAHEVGGKDQSEHLALDAINRLVFKSKTEDEKEYSKVYVLSDILPNLISQLKAKGETLEQVHKNPFLKQLLSKYNIREMIVDRNYNGENKPRKTIQKMMQNKDVKDSIFEQYDASKGKFLTYWNKAIKNQVRDIAESLRNADHLMEQAIRIAPKDDSQGNSHVIHDIKQEEDVLSKSEAKIIKRDLVTHLKKKNPKYETAINLISKGYDIFSGKDKLHFEKELEMEGRDFDHFKLYFFKDLKHAFDAIGVHNPEEGMVVLRTAKIAQKILARIGG